MVLASVPAAGCGFGSSWAAGGPDQVAGSHWGAATLSLIAQPLHCPDCRGQCCKPAAIWGSLPTFSDGLTEVLLLLGFSIVDVHWRVSEWKPACLPASYGSTCWPSAGGRYSIKLVLNVKRWGEQVNFNLKSDPGLE